MVHWPGPLNPERTLPGSYLEGLPYQEGKELRDSSTEIINSLDEEKPRYQAKRSRKKYTVFMAEPTEPTLIAPEIPDIRSSDESEANISPDEKSDSNKTKEQR